MPEDITKPLTIKNFFKENTPQRISTEAIPAMLKGLNQLSMNVVKKAESLSKAENRTTILERDIDAAFKSLSGIESTPEGLFNAIEKLEPDVIGRIALLIAEWVKKHRQDLLEG